MASNASRVVFDGSHWSPVEDVALADICANPLSKRSRVEIYFLPPVKSPVIQDNQDLQKKFSSTFAIPEFFWTPAGYEANGFYRHNGLPNTSDNSSIYSSISRFLFKEIGRTRTRDEFTYKWQYLAFASMWYKPELDETTVATAGAPNQVLLCFDLSDKVKGEIISQFTAKPVVDWVKCPYGVYSVLIRVIVSFFDAALWTFRDPIRMIEKTRPLINIPGQQEDKTAMKTRYYVAHEITRHTIHMNEVLDATARTLRAILQNHNARCAVPNADSCGNSASGEIAFYEQFLENLKLRANAFDRRLQNEITLSYYLCAADDSATAKDILRESRSDGKQLATLVSNLTILFLPATFFSSFFGMNFFDYADKDILLSRSIWLFFVLTVPVTLMAWLLRLHLRQSSEPGGGSFLFKLFPFLRNKRLSRSNNDDDSKSSDNISGSDIKHGVVLRQDTFPTLANRV